MATTTQVAHSNRKLFQWQLASVLLMAAGFGWINGNFVQPVTSSWGIPIDTVHFLPVVILIWVSLVFFGALIEGKYSKGAQIGISLTASSGIITCTVFIILGIVNPNPNSVGVHNFEDAMPVIVVALGALLWFVLVRLKRAVPQASTVATDLVEVLQ